MVVTFMRSRNTGSKALPSESTWAMWLRITLSSALTSPSFRTGREPPRVEVLPHNVRRHRRRDQPRDGPPLRPQSPNLRGAHGDEPGGEPDGGHVGVGSRPIAL